MLVFCWLRRSVPAALVLVVIACTSGIWKPLLVANSAGRNGGKPPASSATGTLATAVVATRSTEISNHPEQSGRRDRAVKGDDWVRTRTGWEHGAKWFAPVAKYEPALHPAIVATLIGLMAVWTLVAFPDDPDRATDEPEPPTTADA